MPVGESGEGVIALSWGVAIDILLIIWFNRLLSNKLKIEMGVELWDLRTYLVVEIVNGKLYYL